MARVLVVLSVRAHSRGSPITVEPSGAALESQRLDARWVMNWPGVAVITFCPQWTEFADQ
jgi:hypothetical protein